MHVAVSLKVLHSAGVTVAPWICTAVRGRPVPSESVNGCVIAFCNYFRITLLLGVRVFHTAGATQSCFTVVKIEEKSSLEVSVALWL